MRKLLLAVAGLAALAAGGSAGAADLPVYKAPPPVVPLFSWTGFYLGVNGGGIVGHTEWTYVASGADASHDVGGGIIGPTAGFNYQFSNRWVGGIEADWDWANVHGAQHCPNTGFDCESDIKSIGTFRARLGPSWDRLWVYATGGLAWGQWSVDTIDNHTPPGNLPVGTVTGQTTTTLGWTAGIGGEWAFSDPLSLKIEWLWFDLGSHTFTVDNAQQVRAHETGNIFRAGLNWHFWTGGGPVVARY